MAFCGGCGTRLPSLCSSCGFANPEGFAFCGKCGARVTEATTPAPQGSPAVGSPQSFTPKHLAEQLSIYARSWLVISLAELGRFEEATAHAAEGIRLAEPTHHAYTIGLAHRAAGTLYLIAGDWAKARSLLEYGVAVLRTGNVRLSLAATMAGAAWALAQLGEASEALRRLREGEHDVAVRATIGMRRAWDDHVLGHTCLLLGQLDEAQYLGERAVELLASQPGGAAHALHLLGDIATHSERFDAEAGETRYRNALALAEPRRMRPLVAHCHFGLGKLYRRTGKREQGDEHLTIATKMYREMDMPFWRKQAEAELTSMA